MRKVLQYFDLLEFLITFVVVVVVGFEVLTLLTRLKLSKG